ncbi:MAG: serpin family protein [Gemmatimonadaceae bacterium]
MRTTALVCSVALALATGGCGFFTDPGPTPQLTELPRALTADEVRVSRAANQFSFRLFQQLNAAQPDSNVFVSPLSVSFSLGMAMNGASGTTLDEMRSTLGFGAAELAEINDGYKGLLALQGGLDPSTTFTIANSVWYLDGFAFHQSFIDGVQQTFNAQVAASPFDQTTITAVNDWVSAHTNGRIPTILDEIKDEDVMFLINAIYFKGSWREQFDPARTRDQAFHGADGAQTVKTMIRPDKTGTMRFGWTPSTTVGELTYGNGAFVMTIAMPNEGSSIDALAAGLDTASWSSLLALMQEHDYGVQLPKFTLEYERQLADDLKALGMNIPFDPHQADFERMTAEQVFISFVKHKTFVLVNEEGTEAAAVTNTGISTTSLPPCLCVDRPFIFAIRERFSGTILFMGKIIRIPA